jgi:glycine oxidase
VRQGNSIVIIGGGVVGLGIGWHLARAGQSVTVLERDKVGRGASWAAAGMLAPLAEAHPEERALLEMGRASVGLYPGFVAELEAASGHDVGYRGEGTLVVGLDRDDTERLRFLYETRQKIGLPVDWLTGAEARRLEPGLSPRVTAALSCPSDHQVDNRALVPALAAALRSAGGDIREKAPVEAVHTEGGRVSGVRTRGELIPAETALLCAGCWSGQLGGVPPEVLPPVRPVKGQMFSVRMEEPPLLRRVVRAPEAYLVPKCDGRLVIGATQEEVGFDTQITAGAMLDLLRGAWEAVPGIYDLPVLETWAGLRPGSPDNAPILGPTALPGLFVATGHFRHGILLLPITAREMSRLILTEEVPSTLRPFLPSRFEGRAQGTWRRLSSLRSIEPEQPARQP